MNPQAQMLSSDQFTKLLNVLERIADRPYTLTGASDWPLFVFMVGIVIALIAFMWRDLGSKITSDKKENKEEHERIWKSQQDCQDACCPRGRNSDTR